MNAKLPQYPPERKLDRKKPLVPPPPPPMNLNDQKHTNTQEMLELREMNSQLRSIRHGCNFVVVAIVLYFLAYVWQVAQFYASIPIEQY